MATKRIKDLTNTAASVASDAYLAIDGTSNGTEKITRDNFRQDTADAFVAAPGTYNLAPLSGGAVEVAKGGTGSTTAAGARTNLSVNSKDEDAQANALKVTAPALYFNGSSSVVTVADDDKLSFTDGTDDLPFTISAFAKMTDATNFRIIGKYGSSNVNAEWAFYCGSDDKLYFQIQTAGTNNSAYINTGALTAYEGQFLHFCAVFGGAGPNSDVGFTNAADAGNMEIYINGVAQSVSRSSGASYAGMSNTSQAVWVGRVANNYLKGHIRDCKIFNRELTASEVAELARGNDLGFADEWANSTALITGDSSAFTSTIGSWSGFLSATLSSVAGGESGNALQILNGAAQASYASLSVSTTAGKRYKLSFYYKQGLASNMRVRIGTSAGGSQVYAEDFAAGASWAKKTIEFVAGGATTYISLWNLSTALNDTVLVDTVLMEQIGTLADFRAERYDTSTNKLYDISNAFVGTGTSVTLTGREVPVYETGTWTPSLTFGGGSTGITYGTQEGYYTRVGNHVTIWGRIVLTSKGSDTGNTLIVGAPYSAVTLSATSMPITIGRISNMSGLTGSPIASMTNATSTVTLQQFNATGVGTITDANFTNTSTIAFSGTYQIQ